MELPNEQTKKIVVVGKKVEERSTDLEDSLRVSYEYVRRLVCNYYRDKIWEWKMLKHVFEIKGECWNVISPTNETKRKFTVHVDSSLNIAYPPLQFFKMGNLEIDYLRQASI